MLSVAEAAWVDVPDLGYERVVQPVARAMFNLPRFEGHKLYGQSTALCVLHFVITAASTNAVYVREHRKPTQER
eukprot:645540-Pleurochrysis_carterae.AAC.3